MKPIKAIPSLVSSLQSNKILQKIKKQKEEGLFRNETEYNDELKRQLIDITNKENKPVFAFTPIANGLAYSEYINKAMDDISLDLEVAFSELNYLFNKVASHQSFYDKTVTEIQSLINKLERNLESIEIEASLDTIYNKVSYDSFLDKSKRLALDSIAASEAYYDDRQEVKTKAETLAEVNTNNGELSLPKFSEKLVGISDISIITTETTVSDFDIQIPGVTTANLINQDSSSIWSYNILTKSRLTAPATLSLEINLGDKKEINQLSISPNANIPCIVKSISYYNENGEEISLDLPEETLTEDRLYSFPKVIAKRLKLKLEQDRNKLIPYDLNAETISLGDLQRDTNLDANLLSISSNVNDQIRDPNIKNILGISQNSITDKVLLNNYVFSLSSIKVSLSDFRGKGIYVSKPVRFKKPSLVGLEATHNIPDILDLLTTETMPSGSIEYSLIKKDYDKESKLLRSQGFNVLPIGQARVLNERLYFDIHKILPLRLLGHKSNGDASNIKIFRNGEELILGADWVFPGREIQVDLEAYTLALTETETLVQILHSDEQILNGTYYAEYTPRYVLNATENVTDKNIRYLESGATMHTMDYFGVEVAYSEVMTKIIIRNHIDSGISSPIIDFYRLNVKEETDE